MCQPIQRGLQMIEAEFVFEFTVVLFDLPAAASGMDAERREGAVSLPDSTNPIVAGEVASFATGSAAIQNPWRMLGLPPTVGRPSLDQGEAGLLCSLFNRQVSVRQPRRQVLRPPRARMDGRQIGQVRMTPWPSPPARGVGRGTAAP